MRTSLVDCLRAALLARVLLRVALMPGTCDTLTPSLLRNLRSRAVRDEDMSLGSVRHSHSVKYTSRITVQNKRLQPLVARAQA